jgi:hypothetical protein
MTSKKMLPVVYMPAAEKYFKKLNDKILKEKYKKAISDIRVDPNIGEMKTGDLTKDKLQIKCRHNQSAIFLHIDSPV